MNEKAIARVGQQRHVKKKVAYTLSVKLRNN
jgi:hypothetical protein